MNCCGLLNYIFYHFNNKCLKKERITLQKGKHKAINVRLLVRIGQTKITEIVYSSSETD